MWTLSVDGASSTKGSEGGVILEDLEGNMIEQALKFAFRTSNNQAEYETLIARMLLAKELGVSQLLAKTDSRLITGQVFGEYQVRDPQLACYLKFVHHLTSSFSSFKLIHVSREQNSHADLLAKLASNSRPGHHKSMIRETLIAPRVTSNEPAVDTTAHINSIETASTKASSSWTTPYITYLADRQLP